MTLTLSESTIVECARRLNQAEKTRTQIRQFSLEWPGLTIPDAYAIQREWVRLKLTEGRTLKGHKIGLTSRAMQRSSNISEPDYGALLSDMFFDNGAEIPANRFIVPRLEVELAFVLKQRLSGPGCTMADVTKATDYVTPAIEIIDARIERTDPATKVTRKVTDTISDNAANAGIVLGGKRFKPGEFDMRWIAALLYRNGVVEESGVAASVLDHPANGVAWLANALHAYGEQLEAGEVVLSGSFTVPVPAQAGDVFKADYGPVGTISMRFV
jgi:2-oxo-hept-3-ene-1,7-dioate hydratase